MKIEEFRTLKVGDMVEYNKLVYELKEIKNVIGGRHFWFSGCTPEFIVVERGSKPYEIIFKNSTVVVDYDNGFYMFKKLSDKEAFAFKYNIRMIRENDLTHLIPKKELELENLKKELDELKQKNMLARMVPGNVYRINYQDYPQETFIWHIRDIDRDNDRVSVTNIKSSNCVSSFAKFGKFYISKIKDIELLPELTEAYKNFTTLLETA
jgi:hypothetical protein